MTTIAASFADQTPAVDIPDVPPPEATPWISRWLFERGGKEYRCVVHVVSASGELLEAVDARTWIEGIPTGRWSRDTQFRLMYQET